MNQFLHFVCRILDFLFNYFSCISPISVVQVCVTMVTIRAASSRDTGNYTCTATNDHGTDSRSVSVGVIKPPTVILVHRLTARSVTLVWKHIEHSRVYRLTYVALSNQSLDRQTGGVDVQYYMRSYTFAELQPDTVYRFCISVRPTSARYDVTSGDWSLWTVDCVEATTPAERDVTVGSNDVRRYVILACAVAVSGAMLACVAQGVKRLCTRSVDWPLEVNSAGSSDRLSPIQYADSSVDGDHVAGDTLSGNEVYENVMATSSSLVSIFTASDLDDIRRTAVLTGNANSRNDY